MINTKVCGAGSAADEASGQCKCEGAKVINLRGSECIEACEAGWTVD